MKANTREYHTQVFIETNLILLSKLTNTEQVLMCVKYSEEKGNEICPSGVIFRYKCLYYCAGLSFTLEHLFYTDLNYTGRAS